MVAPTCNRRTLADGTYTARCLRCADGPVLHVVHAVCFVLRLWLQRRCVVLPPSGTFCTSGTLRAPNLCSMSGVAGTFHGSVQRVLTHPIATFNPLV